MESLGTTSTQDSGRQIGIGDMGRMVKDRKFLIVGSVIGAGILGLAVAFSIPESFNASTVFLLKERSFLAQLYGPAFIQIPFKNNLANIRDDVLSFANLDQVGLSLGLRGEVNSDREWEMLISEFRSNIDIEVRSQKFADDVITISFEDGDKNRVFRVANRLRDAYIESNVAGYQEEIRKLMDRYRARIRVLENQRASVRQNLSRFMQSYQTEVIPGASRNVLQLDQKERRLAELEAQISTLEENGKALQEDFARELPKVQEEISDRNPEYENLRADGIKLRRRLKEMESLYTDIHPTLIDTRAKFSLVEEEIKGTDEFIQTRVIVRDNERYYKLRGAIREGQKKLQLKKSQRASLLTDVQVLNNNIRALPRLQGRKAEMDERLASTGAQLLQIEASLRRMEDLWDRSKEAGGTVYEVIEQARRPRLPSWPNRPLILGIALGLGFAISIALTYLLEMSRQTFGTVAEASERLGIPVMGAIEMIVGPDEILRKRKRRLIAFVSASFVIVVAVAFAVVYHQFPEALPESLIDLLEKL